jgi:hypothetical protein
MDGLMKCFAFSIVLFVLSLCLACEANSGQERESGKPDAHGRIFVQKCTKCHDLTLVEEAHNTKTNAEMKDILRLHKGKEGSEISKQDLKALLELY